MKTLLQSLILVSALLIVSGAVFFWAVAIRKPRKRRHHYPRHTASADAQNGTTHFSAESRKQKRRRRDSEARANPTLAETRGLPPIRDDHRSAAGHYQD